MKSPDQRRRRWIRVRIALLATLLGCAVPAIVWRAFEIQIRSSKKLRQMATSQQTAQLRVAPKRGTIFDRNGHPLAVSVEVDSVWASPRELRLAGIVPQTAAEKLAKALQLEGRLLAERLDGDRQFVWIKRHVTPSQAEAVKALALPGVHLNLEARRYYPNRILASHLLGFANVDGVGIEGVEMAYEQRLRGVPTEVPAIRDRRGNLVFSDQWLDPRATHGDDLTLTIDKTIQFIAERELTRAVQKFQAESGSVVVLDPRNGELLAIANYPTFNPNEPGSAAAAARRNRAITDRFEPGSTIKPFLIAAALDAGVITPNTRVDCEHGSYRIANVTIHDTHAFGRLSVAEVLAYSSNIGSAKIGRVLGREGLYYALLDFGFGDRTGVGLPGESTGMLRSYRRWYEIDAANVAFGQGLSATALQLSVAMASIANGGMLHEPRMVRRMVDSEGRVAETFVTRRSRRVVSTEVARIVADMLTAVTREDGTGLQAAVEGYAVAGKTGTAQKANDHGGGYSRDRLTASFVGFAPVEQPRLVIAVVIDEPATEHSGGIVAAPVFRQMVGETLRYLGVRERSPLRVVHRSASPLAQRGPVG